MARPRYETMADLSKELEVCRLLSPVWKCTFHKLPISYHLDFAATRNGTIQQFIELKCRNVTAIRYPSIFISLSKIIAAGNLYNTTGKDSLLVVRYTDSIRFVSLNAQPDQLTIGGRADRDDPADTEPMAHFNNTSMTTVSLP